jgi:hypothetical protein
MANIFIFAFIKDSIKDLYTFIDCLYCCGQYQRVLSIIKEKDLHKVLFAD